MELHYRNVNDAFRRLVNIFKAGRHYDLNRDTWIHTVNSPSRNGKVMVVDEPVLVRYSHPKERVLFNAARDANPFFHVYEALWMLAGRNDVAPLAYYAKQMSEYSDDGKTLNGAYGYRWRHAHGYDVNTDRTRYTDQLDVIVNHLKYNPHSRRAVLQMWNVENDLLNIGIAGDQTGLGYQFSKDVCCNLSVMFAVREHLTTTGPTYSGKVGDREVHGLRDAVPMKYLDITVTNRSNDMVWGMLGANYVHFTFLQEYMAARIGCEVGRYSHFTNNLHVYNEPDNPKVPKWEPDKWLADDKPDYYINKYVGPNIKTIPLVRDPAVFDEELPRLVEAYKNGEEEGTLETQWREPFFRNVAVPMMEAFHCYKTGCIEDALMFAAGIGADDWRIAATQWLERRKK